MNTGFVSERLHQYPGLRQESEIKGSIRKTLMIYYNDPDGSEGETMPINLTSVDELEDTIANNDIVLIDFWADWCGPCKMFGPIYEKISEKYPEAVFAKCNTEEAQSLAAAFGIQSIPTLAIFREKIMVFKQPGALPEATLDELISKVKTLDMEEVRAKIAEQQQQQAS